MKKQPQVVLMLDEGIPEGVVIEGGRARLISESEDKTMDEKKKDQDAIIKQLIASGVYDKPKTNPFDVTIPEKSKPPAKRKPDGKSPFDVSIPEKRRDK